MLKYLTLALNEALQDEYKARATYRAIIQRYGPVRPFVNIVEAEERHIQALLPLFARYGIPVPADEWPPRVMVPDSLTQACREGVQAEIENGVMYDRLLAMTVSYGEVQQVFRNLQRASQHNHLPAFQRCAARGSSTPINAGCGKARGIAADGGRAAGSPRFSQAEAGGEEVALGGQGQGRRRRRRKGRPDRLN